jgi:hypothetical protein
MAGFKVRLGDGSEIGPMDLSALRTWLSQGLIDGDSPVMRPGSRKWEPLHTVQELKGVVGSRPQSKAKTKARRARDEDDEGETETFDDEASTLDGVRIKAVGIVLLLVAAGFAYLAFRPTEALSAFDGAPWLQLGLGALALGLAVIPGWGFARNLVRVVLILAAFALFPLAGILFAQGERGAGLLALGSFWLLVSGLAALLPRRLGLAGVLIAALPVLVGAFGLVRFGRAQTTEADLAIQEWKTGERRFADDALGLTLDAPEGWLLLKPGNPVVKAPKEARVTLALTRHGGGGYLLTEPAQRGVATPDQYLDRMQQRRRGEQTGWAPRQRLNAVVGSLTGRQLEAVWSDGATAVREVVVSGLDGWTAFALVAWMPEASASRPGGLDDLVRGFAARGLLANRLRAAVDTAVAAVPHLSSASAEQLMSQSEARLLEPVDAFRRSLSALATNIGMLTDKEKAELTRLTTAAYTGLVWKDRARLADYVERVRKGAATTPAEDKEMAELMKQAELRLSSEGRLRLQGYYEKAIFAKN